MRWCVIPAVGTSAYDLLCAGCTGNASSGGFTCRQFCVFLFLLSLGLSFFRPPAIACCCLLLAVFAASFFSCWVTFLLPDRSLLQTLSEECVSLFSLFWLAVCGVPGLLFGGTVTLSIFSSICTSACFHLLLQSDIVSIASSNLFKLFLTSLGTFSVSKISAFIVLMTLIIAVLHRSA